MFKYYKDFCSTSTRILLLIETIVLMAAGYFLISQVTGIIGGMTVIVFHIIIVSMFDFFIFGGIAKKYQKLMDYTRSSFYGPLVVKKAITEDAIISAIRIFAVSVVPYTICAIQAGIGFMDILLIVSLAATGITVLMLSFMIIRSFCSTLQVHMIVSYLISSFASLAFIPAILLLSSADSSIAIGIIYTVLITAIAVVLTILQIKLCVSGFKSGYYDKKQKKED